MVDTINKKTVMKYETRAKEAEVVFTFATAAPEEKATMTVVLKILTNQITTTFLDITACFSWRYSSSRWSKPI